MPEEAKGFGKALLEDVRRRHPQLKTNRDVLIAAITERIGTLSGSLAQLSNIVGTLNESIGSLDECVLGLNDRLAAIEKEIAEAEPVDGGATT